MKSMNWMRVALCAFGASLFACGAGGAGGGEGSFQVVEFLEAGKADLARNTVLNLTFSEPVRADQPFNDRIKIQNVQSGNPSNFSAAIGDYLVSGDQVLFTPRLPERADRSDAGLTTAGDYRVFLRSGPDALRADDNSSLAFPQEFSFGSGDFFEDAVPESPPQGLRLVAVDPDTGTTTDLSRIFEDPVELEETSNQVLRDADLVIDPGAGGAPSFATRWHLDLIVSEPLDPATVTTESVELFQVGSDSLDSANDAATGTPIFPPHRVPIDVELIQDRDVEGNLSVRVRVSPLHTLVDDARYRLVFDGAILGLDFRKKFIGDNGLTGTTSQSGQSVPQVGGLGYVTEFLVFDRPTIESSRTVEYETLRDGISAETGQTALDEADFNTALYDPASRPGRALGFLSAFGSGVDGDFAVTGSTTVTLDTGDTPNESLGNPFDVLDVDPDDTYSNLGLPQERVLTHDSPTATEFHFQTLTVTSSATLRIIGVNPVRFRVQGIVTVNGTIDVAGKAPEPTVNDGGAAGAGGFGGGASRPGLVVCSPRANPPCQSFDQYLDGAGCQNARNGFPFSLKGGGPARGHQGGEFYSVDSVNNLTGQRAVGTGGGGGGHASPGELGEDRNNAGGTPGVPGPACSQTFSIPTSGVIGVRGVGGGTYGERELIDTFVGGSGGGGGGSLHSRPTFGTPGAGGPGGGGGGAIEILSAGSMFLQGGTIDASGGNGGQGRVINMRNNNQFNHPTGGGGGGAGGSVSLVSGGQIDLTSGTLTAAGGLGGDRAHVGTTLACSTCNAGGAGGRGFLFLMDANGEIEGLANGTAGEKDVAEGLLTIRRFDLSRFGNITAVTELFSVSAANPVFGVLRPEDIAARLESGQRILLTVSSARADLDDPRSPDLFTEISAVPVAEISRSGVITVIDTSVGDLSDLNPGGAPARDEFVRVRARFDYDDPVQAALGPFASIDRVTLAFRFN